MGRHSTSLSIRSPSYVASPLLSSKLKHEESGARGRGGGGGRGFGIPWTKHTHTGVELTYGYPYVQWFTERNVRGDSYQYLFSFLSSRRRNDETGGRG